MRNSKRGTKHHAHKLNEDTVRKARALYRKGLCCSCIAKSLDLDVSYSTVWEAVNYATWIHVRDEEV